MYNSKHYRRLTHNDIRSLISSWREDGNEHAYNLILANYIPYIMRRVAHKCGEEYKYEVTHNVIVYLATHLDKYDPDRGNIVSRIYWAIRHVLTDGARKGKVKQDLEEDIHTLCEGEGLSPSPSEIMCSGEYKEARHRAIEQALTNFTEFERSMIRRRFLENASYEDIAEEDGVAYTTTRYRILRLLERMRPYLEEYIDDLR